ncbi:MAG: hypothetical protein JOS17DRAFT_389916 [Linnemannia elongata]|nr:MAG: hypothetical protein JOS17DRAFT_389916 [Linnemannia elongata]
MSRTWIWIGTLSTLLSALSTRPTIDRMLSSSFLTPVYYKQHSQPLSHNQWALTDLMAVLSHFHVYRLLLSPIASASGHLAHVSGSINSLDGHACVVPVAHRRRKEVA